MHHITQTEGGPTKHDEASIEQYRAGGKQEEKSLLDDVSPRVKGAAARTLLPPDIHAGQAATSGVKLTKIQN